MDSNDNPFISSIPSMVDKIEFIKRISKTPSFLEGTSIETRILNTERILSDLFVGLPDHYYFYVRFYSKMMESLRIRIPSEIVKRLLNEELNPVEFEKEIAAHIMKQELLFGSYLIGLAGTGKTTVLKQILGLFPKMTIHKSIGITQVPILVVDASHIGSRKELCRAIFAELDTVLPDSDYTGQFKNLTEWELLEQVRKKVISHVIGTIVIDELQDLRKSKSGPSELTLRFIKYLTNKVGVPFVFIGSLEAEEILRANFQLATRSQGFTWERFEKDEIWEHFIERLFQCNVFGTSQSLTNELKDLYYDLCQGVPRMLKMLHSEVQKVCIFSNKKEIEPRDLLIAAKTLFSTTDLAMYGIKNYNVEVLSKFSDLHHIRNFNTNPQKDRSSERNESKSSNKPESNNKKKRSTKKGDLIDLVQNCKTSNEVYAMLKDNDIITDISEILEF